MKIDYLKQAWLVVALALGFGAALAGVETTLKGRIEANKLAATIRKIPDLVPDANAAVSAARPPLPIVVGQGATAGRYEAFAALDDRGRQLGWVIKAAGKGFADRIELLVGVDANAERITGLAILDQKETPGLGNKIEDQGFQWPFFKGELSARRSVEVVTGASTDIEKNKVAAVGGATISSRSVCDIVNEALRPEVRRALREHRSAGPGEGG